MNIKLSQYAKKNAVTYKTAWLRHKAGKLNSYVDESGRIVVRSERPEKREYVVTYARVSSSENKDNLERQSERLIAFCNANGWQTHQNVTEIGSGLNDNRKKLTKILSERLATKLVVEHRDRLTRFGFNYIKLLCESMGCELIVINETESKKEDLIEDFVSVITSFCARIYGQRRNKRRTEKLIQELENESALGDGK